LRVNKLSFGSVDNFGFLIGGVKGRSIFCGQWGDTRCGVCGILAEVFR
jgi:hypothetical protein